MAEFPIATAPEEELLAFDPIATAPELAPADAPFDMATLPASSTFKRDVPALLRTVKAVLPFVAPDPITDKAEDGVNVPIPTFPLFNIVKMFEGAATANSAFAGSVEVPKRNEPELDAMVSCAVA
jgi:hypothetical protein